VGKKSQGGVSRRRVREPPLRFNVIQPGTQNREEGVTKNQNFTLFENLFPRTYGVQKKGGESGSEPRRVGSGGKLFSQNRIGERKKNVKTEKHAKKKSSKKR